MDRHDLTLRLSGTDVPAGQIDLDSLGGLALSLQQLATRVGRLVIGQHGPGRTAGPAARAVRLRLAGLLRGSTVLEITFGETEVLQLDVGAESAIADRVWEVVAGVQAGKRPEWVTAPVADSVLHVIDALAGAAEAVEIARADGRTAAWRRDGVHREVWMVPRLTTDQVTVTVSGRLEKVDLKDRSFRIRDDVGNAIQLTEVVDPDQAGSLVGKRTVAAGIPSYDEVGRLVALTGPTVALDSPPATWTMHPHTDLEELLAAAPGPDPNGVEGISVADVDAFLALIDT